MESSPLDQWWNADVKIYPDGSQGNYTCTCHLCSSKFIGHKRDSMCGECESKLPKQLDLPFD